MQPQTARSAPPPAEDAAAPWLRLGRNCAAALVLSRQIGDLLGRRAPAAQVTDHLRQAADLSVQLRAQVQEVSRRPLPPACAPPREGVIQQLQALLQQEEENRALLQRQGLRLSLGRPHQYRPGSA
ncbi:MAG: hypothetical protein AB1505_20295 [Candidatus Latescibacterota bacterium]